jgi:hypothetical protein
MRPERRSELFLVLETALGALRADPVRTRAALVALALAMAVLICLTSLVERGRAATLRALEKAGLKNLYLVSRPAAAKAAGLAASPLTSADAGALGTALDARGIVCLRTQRLPASSEKSLASAPVYAVSGPLSEVFGTRARAGRLIGDWDVERKLPYAVAGAALARRISPLAPAVGRIVTAGARSYEIVGELEESFSESANLGEIPSLDWDRALLVPLGTEPGALAEPDSRYSLEVAVLRLATARDADRAVREAARIAPARYGPSGAAAAASPQQTLRHYKQARRTFDRLIWLVGALTTLSAVLGISNLLSAAVSARAREIGVRRAVGARSRDIVLQFQIEGLLLGILGGAAGLALGGIISFFSIDRAAGGPLISVLSFSGLAVSSAAIGVAAGIQPAIRASRIDPAAALREG